MGDFTISYMGCIAHIASHFGFFFADTELVFVLSAMIGSLGVMVGPLIRSMASKVITENQRGKMFALLSVCDNAVPFISTFAYSNTYRHTLGMGYSGVFILSIATQMIVLTLLSIILISNKSQELKPPNEMIMELLYKCSETQSNATTEKRYDSNDIPLQPIENFKRINSREAAANTISSTMTTNVEVLTVL